MVDQKIIAVDALDAAPARSNGNSKGLALDPRPLLDAAGGRVHLERLDALGGRSILHANQFDRQTVIDLCRTAALLEATNVEPIKPLDGKIAITAFFEASTRTRLSFESAMLRLDGKVLSVPDGRVTGIAKGESLADIGEMFNTYGDVVIMRHPETSSVEEIRRNLALPLINAGNGSGQHPTQALLDWYALLKWRPALAAADCPANERIHLGIVGTPGSMRAVKSFLATALLFGNAIRRITIVSELADPVGIDLETAIDECTIPVEMTNDVQEVLSDLDVIYINSIVFLGDSYRQLDSRFRLNADSDLKRAAVIMHPLARRGELDTSLDATAHNMYFAQAAGAVFVRQALLIAVLHRLDKLARFAGPGGAGPAPRT
jgi:aspartate carbamoyltransferase catalytic subunit